MVNQNKASVIPGKLETGPTTSTEVLRQYMAMYVVFSATAFATPVNMNHGGDC
jgi:hypothetical protein